MPGNTPINSHDSLYDKGKSQPESRAIRPVFAQKMKPIWRHQTLAAERGCGVGKDCCKSSP
jgi:hypothetical protein